MVATPRKSRPGPAVHERPQRHGPGTLALAPDGLVRIGLASRKKDIRYRDRGKRTVSRVRQRGSSAYKLAVERDVDSVESAFPALLPGKMDKRSYQENDTDTLERSAERVEKRQRLTLDGDGAPSDPSVSRAQNSTEEVHVPPYSYGPWL